MGNFQYKSSSAGSWTDVPATAYHGTLAGSFDIEYPEATDRDGYGYPCGAIGPPRLVLKSQIMTASGMNFWQSKFSATSSLYTEMWLTVYNPRSTSWQKYTGWLLRPKWTRIQIGSGSLSTLYEGVEIVVDLSASTT